MPNLTDRQKAAVVGLIVSIKTFWNSPDPQRDAMLAMGVAGAVGELDAAFNGDPEPALAPGPVPQPPTPTSALAPLADTVVDEGGAPMQTAHPDSPSSETETEQVTALLPT